MLRLSKTAMALGHKPTLRSMGRLRLRIPMNISKPQGISSSYRLIYTTAGTNGKEGRFSSILLGNSHTLMLLTQRTNSLQQR